MIRSTFGASVQGASHIRSGKECQDSLKKVIKDSDTVILAVADGHGSEACPYSRTGADVAVNVFCKILGTYLDTYAGQPEMLFTFLKREGDTRLAQEIDAEWKHRILKIHARNGRAIRQDTETDRETKDASLIENNAGTANGGRQESGKDKGSICRLYGSTLLGLVLTKEFLFAFQLGDGDIMKVSRAGIYHIIEADKILGTETHSLSREDSWKKAVTFIKRQEEEELPVMYLLSSDGFANSYKDDGEFQKTCREYYDMLGEHGVKAVSEHLKAWLRETSELGCGDDITVLIAYDTM